MPKALVSIPNNKNHCSYGVKYPCLNNLDQVLILPSRRPTPLSLVKKLKRPVVLPNPTSRWGRSLPRAHTASHRALQTPATGHRCLEHTPIRTDCKRPGLPSPHTPTSHHFLLAAPPTFMTTPPCLQDSLFGMRPPHP